VDTKDRLRRLKDEESDLRGQEMKRWRQRANNNEEWASVLNEVRFLEARRAKV
jgi:hypothetical protein